MSGGLGSSISIRPATPQRGTAPLTAAHITLEALIATLADMAEKAALAAADPKGKNHEAVVALKGLLAAFEQGVVATSNSSNSRYALQDMDLCWREHHARAKHAIKLLDLLYGPQQEPCHDPGAHAD